MEQERKGDEVIKDLGRQRAIECFVRTKDRWELASLVREPLWLCGGAGQAK